ncbi:hypothetical protein [Amycolatopsis sp. NPDC059657]
MNDTPVGQQDLTLSHRHAYEELSSDVGSFLDVAGHLGNRA